MTVLVQTHNIQAAVFHHGGRHVEKSQRGVESKPRAISAFEGGQVRNLLLQGGDSDESVPCQTCSFNLQGPAQWSRIVSRSSLAEDGLDRCHCHLVTLTLKYLVV